MYNRTSICTIFVREIMLSLRHIFVRLLFTIIISPFFVNGVPTEDVKLFTLDTNKVYPPDPPSSVNVLMGFKYFDEVLQRERVVDFTVALFNTLTPKATKNFQMMSSGFKVVTDPKHPENIVFITYANTPVYKVIPGVQVEAGVIFPTFPFCLYGKKFEDESFALKHDRPGRVSLVSTGPDTNESKFIIGLDGNGAPEKNGKNVVFGQVISGLEDLINAMNHVNTDANNNHSPSKPMQIHYSIVDELRISNINELAREWETDVKAFEQGDLSKGFKFKSTKTKHKNSNDSHLSDFKYDQLNHPVIKIMMLLVLLALFYILARYRNNILSYLSLNKHKSSIRGD